MHESFCVLSERRARFESFLNSAGEKTDEKARGNTWTTRNIALAVSSLAEVTCNPMAADTEVTAVDLTAVTTLLVTSPINTFTNLATRTPVGFFKVERQP